MHEKEKRMLCILHASACIRCVHSMMRIVLLKQNSSRWQTCLVFCYAFQTLQKEAKFKTVFQSTRGLFAIYLSAKIQVHSRLHTLIKIYKHASYMYSTVGYLHSTELYVLEHSFMCFTYRQAKQNIV